MSNHPQVQEINISIVGASVPQTTDPIVALDSTNTINASITSVTQRAGLSVADVAFAIYADGIYLGVGTSLAGVSYSTNPAGPWTAVDDIYTTDPAYTFPASGVPAGAAGNVPVGIDYWVAATLYFRVQIHVAGNPDMYAYGPGVLWSTAVAPPTPASITVPATSLGTYTVSWAGVTGYSITYRVQEDTDPAFGSPTSHTLAGTSRVFTNLPGTYYYRVRAENPTQVGAWRTGANPCVVEVPVTDLRITPDLGWVDLDEMLDPAHNGCVVSVAEGDIVPSAETPRTYFGPNFPVLDIDGTPSSIPVASVRQLGIVGRHYYKKFPSGSVGTVYLLTCPRGNK